MSTKEFRPPQKQHTQPGHESEMTPEPKTMPKILQSAGRLQDKVAIITGSDSGIGRAVAIEFAKEGCDIVIMYLNEHKDAEETQAIVEQFGRRALIIAGDIGNEIFCKESVEKAVQKFGRVDILVNNAGEQHLQKDILNITEEQLEKTFRTNIFSQFFMVKAVLPYLKKDAAIINTASVTAYRGSPHLIDYSATKGAIVSFTRSLSQNLIKKGIRVNAVAPGAVWTPLIVSTFPPEEVKSFGTDNPMARAGEPNELAPAYVYLASSDSSFMTGQVLHPNGGEVVNG